MYTCVILVSGSVQNYIWALYMIQSQRGFLKVESLHLSLNDSGTPTSLFPLWMCILSLNKTLPFYSLQTNPKKIFHVTVVTTYILLQLRYDMHRVVFKDSSEKCTINIVSTHTSYATITATATTTTTVRHPRIRCCQE